MENYLKLLMENQDLKYRDFIAKLNPAVNKKNIIGVRTPALRKIAKELSAEEKNKILNSLPHKYLEEYFLHSFSLTQEKNWDTAVKEVERLLPYVDNWALSDTLNPKVLIKKPKEFEALILNKYLKSSETYTIRYGLVMLLRYYCEKVFSTSHFKVINSITNDDYYVRMAIAWYYSVALVKQWEATIPYFEKFSLPNKWTHNKSLQKARESFRISDEKKEYLKSLKIK